MIGKKLQFDFTEGYVIVELTKALDAYSYWGEVIHANNCNFSKGFNIVVYKSLVGDIFKDPSIDVSELEATGTIFDLEESIKNASEEEKEWLKQELSKIK